MTRAFAAREPVRSASEAETQSLCPEFMGAAQPPAAAIWQPVIHDDVAVAVMAFYWHSAEGLERASLGTVIELLTAETAVTLQRVSLLNRLESVARTDDLTGLPNRRAWEEELPREMARSKRDGKTLCICLLDLDRFKEFNDASGHQAGDRLLKQAASEWTAHLRETDVLARYGGEEFALALPGVTHDQDRVVVS